MAKTSAERMRQSRDRQRNSATPPSATDVAQQPSATGPLDVYSVARWAYLQDGGHVWVEQRGRSGRPDGLIGVTVPGDPAYKGIAC